MNALKNGTIAVGAPGSIARKQAETEDLLRGLLYGVQDVMDDLAFHVQTTRFRPSDSTVVKLTSLKNAFNEAKHAVFPEERSK
jgi:hypothetical protein